MAKNSDALLKIPSEVPSGKDVPFQDITVMSFAEAKALDTVKLEEHGLALGGEFVKRAGSAVKFVMLHRSALCELRKRYSQQGRRNPVPGSPSWGEFCTNVFHVSQQYMNSILASAYPKKLVAKKKTAKKDAAVSTSITDIPTDDGDPRPEAEGMNGTAAQAIAPISVKLAKMVADGHGGSKDAKAFAKEIIEVDADEPFLPTEVNTTANLSVIQRLWEKLFQDGSYTMPEAAKKGVITKFVKGLSDEDFALVANAVTARTAKQRLPGAVEALAVSEGIPFSHRDSVRRKVRQDLVRQINEDPELDDEGKAAAVAFVNELGKEEEDAAVKAGAQVDTVTTDALGRMLGDDVPVVLVSPEPEPVAAVLKPEPVKKGRVWSVWVGRECPLHHSCGSHIAIRSTTPVAARLEAQRLLDDNQWPKPWRDFETNAACAEAYTVKSWVGSVSNAGNCEHDIDITNQDPARKKAARLVHVKELMGAAEERLKGITGEFDEDADDRRYTEEARDVERAKIARLERERATLEVAVNAAAECPVSDEVKAAALATLYMPKEAAAAAAGE